MKLRSVSFGILAVSLVMIFTLVVPAGDVHAEDGQLTAYINGVDVSSYNSPGNALEVYHDEILAVSVYAPAFIESHQIDLAFTDIASWTVSDEEDDGDEYFYAEIIEVADYTDYGVGLYKVTARADLVNGDSYYTEVYIKIIGGSFLDSWIGIAALAAFILGLLILLVRLLIIFRGSGSPPTIGLLLPVLPLAVLPTVAMVTDGDGKPSSEDSQTTGAKDTPQTPSGSKDNSGGGIKFRPRISILSIVGALLSAIGLVLMLQQMGTVYPTITVVVLSLVLALVAGIVLPTLAQTFSRRRK